MHTLPRPAHHTKDQIILKYPFQSATFSLAQRADGVRNGTALWLGGQCLAFYLAQNQSKFIKNGARAIELGSGIGMTALALSSLGWDVLATDTKEIYDAVLSANISNNIAALPSGSGTIQTRELDWFVDPQQWNWHDPASVTSPTDTIVDDGRLLEPPFDLIFSADTVYSRDLVTPLLRTMHNLSKLSHSLSGRHPFVILCIERRDPLLVDGLIQEAKQEWEFEVDRIPRTKVAKCIEKAGVKWDRDDWDGVEVWRMKIKAS